MISTNFFPNEPVPPVTRTICSAQFIEPASTIFLSPLAIPSLAKPRLTRPRQRPTNRATLHFRQPRNLECFENRRGDVVEPHALHWRRRRCTASGKIFPLGHQKNSVPVVVGAVRPGVVLLVVDFSTAHHPARSPIQVTEENTQIGSDVSRFFVSLFGEDHARSNRASLGVA